MRTGKGWLYLAVVLDQGSRRLLGCPMSDRIDTRLVTDALDMADAARQGRAAGIVFHFDRGSQYLAKRLLTCGAGWGLAQSVGRVGSSADDAVAESFFPPASNESSSTGTTAQTAQRHAGRSSSGSPATTPAWIAEHPTNRKPTTVTPRRPHPPYPPDGPTGEAPFDHATPESCQMPTNPAGSSSTTSPHAMTRRTKMEQSSNAPHPNQSSRMPMLSQRLATPARVWRHSNPSSGQLSSSIGTSQQVLGAGAESRLRKARSNVL